MCALLPANSKLGLTLANHEAPTDGPGVKVIQVDFDGRAARAGLSAGDALMSVCGVICTDHAQAIKLLNAHGHEDMKIVFMNKYTRDASPHTHA